MLEKMNVFRNDGEIINVDLISNFTININDNLKEFFLCTANELDQNGLVKIWVAESRNGKLSKIIDENDWSRVKNAMRSIISGSEGDYAYKNPEANLTCDGEFYRVIAVQEAAKNELVKNFDENRPKEVEQNKLPEVEENEIDSSIYPQVTEENAGSEVVPGIVEQEPVNEEPIAIEENQEEINPLADFPNIEPEFNNDTEPEQSVEAEEPVVVPSFNDFAIPSEEPTVQEQEIASTVEESIISVEPNTEIPSEEQNYQEDITNNIKIEEPTQIEENDPRKILVRKIMEAVDEFIASQGNNNSTYEEEINRLRKELDEKNRKIKEILNLLENN